MEGFPSPEGEEHLLNQCPECELYTELTDDNTIIFQAEDGSWNAYVRCDNGCDPETMEISPHTMAFFGYLTNWYTQEGKIDDLQIKGVLLGEVEVIEVVETPPLEQQWDNFINYVEPWEIAQWGHYRRVE